MLSALGMRARHKLWDSTEKTLKYFWDVISSSGQYNAPSEVGPYIEEHLLSSVILFQYTSIISENQLKIIWYWIRFFPRKTGQFQYSVVFQFLWHLLWQPLKYIFQSDLVKVKLVCSCRMMEVTRGRVSRSTAEGYIASHRETQDNFDSRLLSSPTEQSSR